MSPTAMQSSYLVTNNSIGVNFLSPIGRCESTLTDNNVRIDDTQSIILK